MDPNANIEAQVSLLLTLQARGYWTRDEREEFADLQEAYRGWRASGGFPAPPEALSWYFQVLDEVRPLVAENV